MPNPKEQREEVKRDAPRAGVTKADVAAAPLYPAEGGSYTRAADGGLRRREKPTEPATPEITDAEREQRLTEADREAMRRSEAAAARASKGEE